MPVAAKAGPASGLRRVLIAEDDDVNAVIATAYLEHLGVQAERVHDGGQARPNRMFILISPDNTPSVLPGIVELGLGNNFTNYFRSATQGDVRPEDPDIPFYLTGDLNTSPEADQVSFMDIGNFNLLTDVYPTGC